MSLKPFVFQVTVEVERTEGKFASRDEIAEKIAETISDADPGQIDTDDGAVYEIVSFEVDQS
jgi:hypothetical protein